MYLSEEPNGSPDLNFNWGKSRRDHLVQWYDRDPALVQSVASYVSHALDRGEAAIVIGTKAHREQIEGWLQNVGVDVQRLEKKGRYIARDAEETLDKFVINGQPDANKFNDVVGTLVSRATNSWSGVRAFGEMVGVLWENGNPAAAIQLENLWHKVIQEYSLPLFCAYPKGILKTEEERDSFSRVCDAHDVVIL